MKMAGAASFHSMACWPVMPTCGASTATTGNCPKIQGIHTNQFDAQRGYYGTIGDRTIIKNCSIIKDVKIGSDAYIKGANKLKTSPLTATPTGSRRSGKDVNWLTGSSGTGAGYFMV